ncbi:PrpF domain-containing protein [Sciscionella sediminilitoris]|uniref:PrpF domain-containing protein n=1 Tax=Sciscionella sediminilitoris TaxID=1445613 RepID=UPI0004DF25C0|nr:PrpF domain-containing protein [Sciscionella sp. SE31]
MHVSASLVRGGTSKCWLFDHRDVPATLDGIERLLVDAYGAADPGQLDGVGGATPTTSKAAVIAPSKRPGIDVDYLFGQVGIGSGRVEWGSNCGNCATAIALWSVRTGLVPVTGDRTEVALRNTNTGAVLRAEVDTEGGVLPEFGEQTVPGTRARGVRVGLSFLNPVSAPPPSPRERLGDAVVSMLDAGAPMVLVDAEHAGRTGAETPAELRADVPWLCGIRQAAAPRFGIAEPGDAAPKVGYVGVPVDYLSSTGQWIGAQDYDVSARMLSMRDPHPVIGLTSAVGIATANLLDGSVVHARSAAPGAATLRIGTAGGVLTVHCSEFADGLPRTITVRRAARIICEAQLFVPEPVLTVSA